MRPMVKVKVGEDEGEGGVGVKVAVKVGVNAKGGEGGRANLRISGRVARCASTSSDLWRESIGPSSAKQAPASGDGPAASLVARSGKGRQGAARGGKGRQGAARGDKGRRCQDGACGRAALPPHERRASFLARHEDGTVGAW